MVLDLSVFIITYNERLIRSRFFMINFYLFLQIPMELDLASFSSITEFANEVLKKFSQIHVLINNAGVYAPLKDHAFTKDGFEIHFGVNHLGHFLLTNLLLDRLKESAPSRLVII